MTVRIRESAVEDLAMGRWFYEKQGGSGLGEYFMDSLFSDIDSLSLNAGIHPVMGGYFRMLSKRFPFAIYYRVEGEVAEVWKVLDCRRTPEWIEGELE